MQRAHGHCCNCRRRLTSLLLCSFLIHEIPGFSVNSNADTGNDTRDTTCSTQQQQLHAKPKLLSQARQKVQTKSKAPHQQQRQNGRSRVLRNSDSKLLQAIAHADHRHPATVQAAVTAVAAAIADPRAYRLYDLIQASADCAAKGLAEELVIQLVDSSFAAGYSPNVAHLTRSVDAASKAKRWSLVETLLGRMHRYSVPPNQVTYGAVLSALAKAGEVPTIDSMIANSKVQMTQSMWNSIISAFAGGRQPGRYEICIRYFQMMMRSGTAPDDMTFSNLICAARDGSSDCLVQRGQRLLALMHDEWGIAPDVFCLNSLMGVYLAAGKPESALQVRTGVARAQNRICVLRGSDVMYKLCCSHR